MGKEDEAYKSRVYKWDRQELERPTDWTQTSD